MIKAREFYSDVWVKDDDKNIIKCKNCNKKFKAGDLLLNTGSIEEFPYEETITEHCLCCGEEMVE